MCDGLSRVNMISYADDIIVMAPSAIGLQKLLDKICSHLNVLDLFVNTSKPVLCDELFHKFIYRRERSVCIWWVCKKK